MVRTSPAVPLLRYAAEQAFWPLSQSSLHELCKQLKVEHVGNTVVPLLKALITKYVPDVTNEMMLGILKKRLKPRDRVFEEIFQSEEIQDALEKDQQKEVAKINKEDEEEKKVERTIKEEVTRLRVRVRLDKLRADRKQGEEDDEAEEPAEKKRRLGTVERGERRRVPPGDGDLSEEAVADLLPEEAAVRKCHDDNRWRIRCGSERLSRSWVMRTPRDCIKEVLQFAWDCHFLNTGERCPVSGLYPTKRQRAG